MSAPNEEGFELHERIDRLLTDGTLPSGAPARVWAGHGEGHACDACGRPIAGSDVEYELLFSGHPHTRTLRLHRQCYSAWQSRRQPGSAA